jgi:hypothetical protein
MKVRFSKIHIFISVTFMSLLHIDLKICILVVYVLRHYATSQKVVGSSPDEVEFFILPATLWPCGRLSL